MAPAARLAMKWREPIRKTPISGMTDMSAPAMTIDWSVVQTPFIGDRDELREASELAYRIGRDGLSAGAPEGSPDLYGVITSGRQQVGAVRWGLAFPESAVPKTEGT